MASTTEIISLSQKWNANIWDWPLQHNDGTVKVINTPEKFEVALEVYFFTPKEIEVKVCGEQLLIHCMHIEKDPSGRYGREIHRAYNLPLDVNLVTLKSHLTQNGILIVSAAKNKF